MLKQTIILPAVLVALALPAIGGAQERRCQSWPDVSWTVDEVTFCLEAGADPNARDEIGETLLHKAAKYGLPLAVTEALLAAGADPNARSNSTIDEDYTPLLFAIELARHDVYSEEAEAAELVHGTIEALLAAGADPNARGRSGVGPLFMAAGRSAAIVEMLLAADADPNARAGDQGTPLHFAASRGNAAVVGMLLAAGAEPNVRNVNGETPADWCRFPGCDRLLPATPISRAGGSGCQLPTWLYREFWETTTASEVADCLAAGSDPNARNEANWTPLLRAVEAAVNGADNLETIEALLAAGADPNVPNGASTSLHRAASWGGNVASRGAQGAQQALIEALLAAGADPNARDHVGETPLHEAAAWGDRKALIEVLLAAGADISARDNDGETPLHNAATFSDWKAVTDALLAAGADIRARDSGGRTPLHAAAFSSDNWKATFEPLLAAGADPNARDDNARTPLYYAAQSIQDNRAYTVAILEALLAAGADPNAGRAGALHAAARSDNPAFVEMLLAAGADPNVGDGGETPLHDAALHSSNPVIVEALLAAGVDPNARDVHGETPLHRVAIIGEPAIAEALLAAGADPNVRSNNPRRNGATPLQLAGDNPAVAETLRAAQNGSRLTRTARGRCLIPGFPDPADPETLGLPWCPASVGFQIRAFALSAAGAQCAIATGSSSTPEQIEARNRETADLCARLDAVAERFGGAECRCPADWR